MQADMYTQQHLKAKLKALDIVSLKLGDPIIQHKSFKVTPALSECAPSISNSTTELYIRFPLKVTQCIQCRSQKVEYARDIWAKDITFTKRICDPCKPDHITDALSITLDCIKHWIDKTELKGDFNADVFVFNTVIFVCESLVTVYKIIPRVAPCILCSRTTIDKLFGINVYLTKIKLKDPRINLYKCDGCYW